MKKKRKKKFLSPFDFLGSYTGKPYDEDDLHPVQDVDDL